MLESNELERKASHHLIHHHRFGADTVVAVSLYSYFAVVVVLVAVLAVDYFRLHYPTFAFADL